MDLLQRAATAAATDGLTKSNFEPPSTASISINMFGEKNTGLLNAMGPKNLANLMKEFNLTTA